MAKPSLQAVIHGCLGDPDDAGLNPRQRQVCRPLLDCRTAALGGFCLECDQCQDRAFLYHACRDRHCPRCQRRASQAGQLPRVQDRSEVDRVLKALMGKDWVVYSKPGPLPAPRARPPSLGGEPRLGRTETVVDYLGRYSHRVALSDSRLLSFDGETVELAYKDYRDGDQKVMALTGEELVRRFLLHVLPKGLMRVRHFGFLANRCRARRLGEIRVALEAPSPQAPPVKAETAPFDGYPCPKRHKGRLQVIARLAPQRRNPGGPTRSPP